MKVGGRWYAVTAQRSEGHVSLPQAYRTARDWRERQLRNSEINRRYREAEKRAVEARNRRYTEELDRRMHLIEDGMISGGSGA
jgi:hypothetical protein